MPPDVVNSPSSYVRQSSPAAVDIMSRPAPPDLPERMFPSDESAFFRDVRLLLKNTTTNDAFLKLLNLYHQNIIDRDTLVIRSASFLQSNPYLYDHLKELVGYTSLEKPAVDAFISTEEPAYGPSYRTVAKSVNTYPPCKRITSRGSCMFRLRHHAVQARTSIALRCSIMTMRPILPGPVKLADLYPRKRISLKNPCIVPKRNGKSSLYSVIHSFTP